LEQSPRAGTAARLAHPLASALHKWRETRCTGAAYIINGERSHHHHKCHWLEINR
jgi:hypothetical protein